MVYMQFDNPEATFQVATTTGWGGFGTWIAGQDAPLTQQLFETGQCDDAVGLRSELDTLKPPPEKNVASVLDQIIYNLDAGEPATTVLITNGVQNQ